MGGLVISEGQILPMNILINPASLGSEMMNKCGLRELVSKALKKSLPAIENSLRKNP
jgi:hypothetical protein